MHKNATHYVRKPPCIHNIIRPPAAYLPFDDVSTVQKRTASGSGTGSSLLSPRHLAWRRRLREKTEQTANLVIADDSCNSQKSRNRCAVVVCVCATLEAARDSSVMAVAEENFDIAKLQQTSQTKSSRSKHAFIKSEAAFSREVA